MVAVQTNHRLDLGHPETAVMTAHRRQPRGEFAPGDLPIGIELDAPPIRDRPDEGHSAARVSSRSTWRRWVAEPDQVHAGKSWGSRSRTETRVVTVAQGEWSSEVMPRSMRPRRGGDNGHSPGERHSPDDSWPGREYGPLSQRQEPPHQGTWGFPQSDRAPGPLPRRQPEPGRGGAPGHRVGGVAPVAARDISQSRAALAGSTAYGRTPLSSMGVSGGKTRATSQSAR